MTINGLYFPTYIQQQYQGEGGGSVYAMLISQVSSIYLICYMFQSYDHLHVEIYLLELTLLTTDPLFLEY
jgi:hypothetical protein